MFVSVLRILLETGLFLDMGPFNTDLKVVPFDYFR